MDRKKTAFIVMRAGAVMHLLNAVGLVFLPKIAKWSEVMKCVSPTPLLGQQVHNRPMVFLFNYEWAVAFFGLAVTFWYLASLLRRGSRVAALVSIIHGCTWIGNLILYLFFYPKDLFGMVLIVVMVVEIFIWLFPLWNLRSEFSL